MSVLIISPFFFPEPISTGKYNTVLAQRLVARGEEVVVITSHPLYPKWRPEYADARLTDIRIERGGAWLRYPRSATLRRMVLELWFALFASVKYLRVGRKSRHAVVIFPPNLFFLCLSPVLTRGTAITGIVHDLQSVLTTNLRSPIGRLGKFVVAWIESRSLRKCHQLVFLSHSMADHAIRRFGLKRDRCVVCYPFQTIAAAGDVATTALAQLLLPDDVNVVYSGALGDKQCPDKLYAFMSELARHYARVRCHIFSAGPHFDRLKDLHSEDGRSGVAFRDLVPAENLEELYARSSIQLIPQAGGTSEGSLPSKLPNLLAAGVPIFAISDSQSEISRIIEESGAGISVPAFSSGDIMSRFDALLTAIRAEPRGDRIRRLRPFVDRTFSIERVVDTILAD